MSDYPLGAKNDKDAPYNQLENETKKIKVLVSVTLSKTVEIEVKDYIKAESTDEDNDYSDCDLKSAVEQQIYLPQDSYEDWNVDDFEVILD